MMARNIVNFIRLNCQRNVPMKQIRNLYLVQDNNLYNCTIIKNNILCLKRQLATDITSNTVDEQNEDEDIRNSKNLSDKLSIRNVLFEYSEDHLIHELNECSSVQQVLNIINQKYNVMNYKHISQSVIVLWDLQKKFYKYNAFFDINNDPNTNSLLKKYMDEIIAHDDFQKLLKLIELNYDEFSLDAATCTLLYLSRMGIPTDYSALQLIIKKFESEMKTYDKSSLPLTALSRFIVAMYNKENFYSILYSIDIFPIILHRLMICETAEEFKLLTICLNKLRNMILLKHLEIYKEKCEHLIDSGIIDSQSSRVIIKAIKFLNQTQWYEYTTAITRKLMYLIRESIQNLSNTEVILLFKALQLQKEPADMIQDVENHATKLLSEMKHESNSEPIDTSLDLLSSIVSFSSPLQRPKFENLARQYVDNKLTFLSLSSLYKIIFYLKSSDTKLCNEFWTKSLNIINSDRSNKKLSNLVNLCQKYMYFITDVSNRYRYQNFEISLVDSLKQEIDLKVAIPENFVQIASFFILCCNDFDYVQNFFALLLNNISEFNDADILNLSKTIQYLNENKTRRNNIFFLKLINDLNDKINQYISTKINENKSLPNINVLLRSYTIRNENNEDLFKNIVNYYITSQEEFTSHILKDISFSLRHYDYLMPELIDKMIDYIIKSKQCILGSTVEKVLYLCYYLGYTPCKQEFFHITSELIIRDKDRFSGLSLLQSCLAFCYFHKLPDLLLKLVFSVDFLEKLDDELSNCYAKTTYPTRVRHYLMQLNRAVCLDYPEFNVPWFHEKYVNELKIKENTNKYFQNKVSSALNDLKTKNEIIFEENKFSAYGYLLDFEIRYNSKCYSTHQDDLSRAVLMLLNEKSYTKSIRNLKGYHCLKKRHLEILGYDVISIHFSEWKLLYSQEHCIEYLKSKLWSNKPPSSVQIN